MLHKTCGSAYILMVWSCASGFCGKKKTLRTLMNFVDYDPYVKKKNIHVTYKLYIFSIFILVVNSIFIRTKSIANNFIQLMIERLFYRLIILPPLYISNLIFFFSYSHTFRAGEISPGVSGLCRFSMT